MRNNIDSEYTARVSRFEYLGYCDYTLADSRLQLPFANDRDGGHSARTSWRSIKNEYTLYTPTESGQGEKTVGFRSVEPAFASYKKVRKRVEQDRDLFHTLGHISSPAAHNIKKASKK